MSRSSLTAATKALLVRGFAGDGLRALVTIAHAALASTRRYAATKAATVTSGGQNFTGRGMNIALPDDVPEGIGEAQLAIDTVDETLHLELRDAEHPYPVVTLQLVLISDPEDVQLTVVFDATDWSPGDSSITLNLTSDTLATEPFPAGQYTPSVAPDLF